MTWTARPWVAFRLDLVPPFEPSVPQRVVRRLRTMQAEGRLARWFFLWYGQGGFHLRLRMQPAAPSDVERVVRALEELEQEPRSGFTLRRQVYERDALAFGETRESVLAELLHAATSDLALGLLSIEGQTHGSARRWTLAAATAGLLAERAIPGPGLDRVSADWLAFLVRANRDVGLTVAESGAKEQQVRLAALRAVLPRLRPVLAADASARKAVRLLRRLRQRGPHGCFVAIHALHMFCNEMNITLPSEHDIVASLRALWLPRVPGRAGQSEESEPNEEKAMRDSATRRREPHAGVRP